MKLKAVNNEYYNTLGTDWYESNNNPIAILRQEQRTKTPWILKHLKRHFNGSVDLSMLDIGCGAGFLTNELSKKYTHIAGLDASASSLEIAKEFDKTKKVKYILGNAMNLPFEPETFDSVFAMDFLEHVQGPKEVVFQAANVLKKNGLFFFHTFNRNPLSWLVIIKFMEWFVPNTPKDLHRLEYFIKPEELVMMMKETGLELIEIKGIRPCFDAEFFRCLFKREVSKEFRFKINDSLTLGYIGVAKKL